MSANCANLLANCANKFLNMRMKIGNRIRQLRLAQGMKIAELATAIGIDAGNVSRLETGKQKTFTEQTLTKIADALSVTVIDLLIDQGSQNAVCNNSTISQKGKEVQGMYRVDILDLSASAGPGIISSSDVVDIVRSIEYNSEHALSLFGRRPASTVKVINVRGDSMMGTLEPGDLIFVDVNINSFDGDGVYVFGFDHKIHVKRLQSVPDKLLVISDNTNYKEWSIDSTNEHRFHVFGKVLMSQTSAYKKHA